MDGTVLLDMDFVVLAHGAILSYLNEKEILIKH